MLKTLLAIGRPQREPSVESLVREHLSSTINDARRKGVAKLTIRVGEITKALNLSQSSQSGSIARVLESKRFHESQGLTLYYRSGPRFGSHTMYYFDLTAGLKPLEMDESGLGARGSRIRAAVFSRLALSLGLLGVTIVSLAAAWFVFGS